MTTALMEMEPEQLMDDAPEQDDCKDSPGEAAAGAAADMAVLAEQQICPMCDGVIPKECVEGKPAAGVHDFPHSFTVLRTVTIYCPHCAAGRQAEFTIRDGRPVQVTPSRLLMGEAVRHLRDRLAAVRGEIRWDARAGLVENVQAAMDEEAKSDRGRLARAIQGAHARLLTLQNEYDRRYGRSFPRPLLPEDRAGIDRAATDCDLADALVPDAAPSIGGRSGVVGPACNVPPERTFDPSTSQEAEEPERWDGLS